MHKERAGSSLHGNLSGTREQREKEREGGGSKTVGLQETERTRRRKKNETFRDRRNLLTDWAGTLCFVRVCLYELDRSGGLTKL